MATSSKTAISPAYQAEHDTPLHPHDTQQYVSTPNNLVLNGAESPLDTLVRRTSSRRMRTTASAGKDRQQLIQEQRRGQRQQQNQAMQAYSSNLEDDASNLYSGDSPPSAYGHPYSSDRHVESERLSEGDQTFGQSDTATQPRLQIQVHPPNSGYQTSSLASPLLHSQFARDSVATASSADGNSYYDMSLTTSAAPDMRASYASSSLSVKHKDPRSRNSTQSNMSSQSRADSERMSSYQYFGGPNDDASSVYSQSTIHGNDPALRDSWRSADTRTNGRSEPPRSARLESNDDVEPNYSSPSSSAVPTLVISSPSMTYGDGGTFPDGRAAIIKPLTANFSRPVRSQSPETAIQGERVTPQLPPDMREQKKAVLERHAKRAASPSQMTPPAQIPVSQKPSHLHLGPNLQSRSASPTTPVSPVSLYSNYSYYPYENSAPSPTNSVHAGSGQSRPTQGLQPDARRTKSSLALRQETRSDGPLTPEDYLQLGIQHHEANRMQESVRCFERSANEGGGCGVGMLMYGLALRHGWGCAKNEVLGFKWLRKAAEYAVDDLEKIRTGGSNVEIGAVQTEMVLAIYEVGQCFFHGWGVRKDQKMGVSYYAVAARLGDSDAQGDLGFCLANGKGCKKDKKEAAKWYREAVKQGQSDVGLAWIYKEKYQ